MLKQSVSTDISDSAFLIFFSGSIHELHSRRPSFGRENSKDRELLASGVADIGLFWPPTSDKNSTGRDMVPTLLWLAFSDNADALM
jgi:hypothetical protein